MFNAWVVADAQGKKKRAKIVTANILVNGRLATAMHKHCTKNIVVRIYLNGGTVSAAGFYKFSFS